MHFFIQLVICCHHHDFHLYIMKKFFHRCIFRFSFSSSFVCFHIAFSDFHVECMNVKKLKQFQKDAKKKRMQTIKSYQYFYIFYGWTEKAWGEINLGIKSSLKWYLFAGWDLAYLAWRFLCQAKQQRKEEGKNLSILPLKSPSTRFFIIIYLKIIRIISFSVFPWTSTHERKVHEKEMKSSWNTFRVEFAPDEILSSRFSTSTLLSMWTSEHPLPEVKSIRDDKNSGCVWKQNLRLFEHKNGFEERKKLMRKNVNVHMWNVGNHWFR